MKKTVEINGKKIGYDEPVYFIAEMSANHLHNFERAKKIIQEAKYAGADAIKLQTYRPDTITIDCYTDEFMATPGSPWDGMNLYELYKTAYTPWEWHKELMEYANSIGITCFSSPFDLTAVDFLEELNVPAYKIASFEINDIPLIRKAAKTGKKYLVIVESPAKAATIGKFLGNNYKIEASMGHVRDMPKSQMGIDFEHDFEPKYITIRGKGELLGKLRKDAKAADKVYLATDPDREGEAISWHLLHALNLGEENPSAYTFNEITKNGSKKSITEARDH